MVYYLTIGKTSFYGFAFWNNWTTFRLFRNQAEVGHTCRGSINLQGAFIHAEDSCSFVVSNGGTQTFHLKAASEVERQKWVTALELARVRAIRAAESGDYFYYNCQIWLFPNEYVDFR